MESAGGGNRTHTPLSGPRILSPVRLPVPPPRHSTTTDCSFGRYDDLRKRFTRADRVFVPAFVPAAPGSASFSMPTPKRSEVSQIEQPPKHTAAMVRPSLATRTEIPMRAPERQLKSLLSGNLNSLIEESTMNAAISSFAGTASRSVLRVAAIVFVAGVISGPATARADDIEIGRASCRG